MLEEFVNQTTWTGFLIQLNNGAENSLGVGILLSILIISFFLTLKTSDGATAVTYSFLIGFVFSVLLYYLTLISAFWVGLMILGFVGSLIYNHYSD